MIFKIVKDILRQLKRTNDLLERQIVLQHGFAGLEQPKFSDSKAIARIEVSAKMLPQDPDEIICDECGLYFKTTTKKEGSKNICDECQFMYEGLKL